MKDAEIKNFVKNIIAAYEKRMKLVKEMIDDTEKNMAAFSGTRGQLTGKLRDNLAENASLRRSDFDKMMKDILRIQEQKEKEVKEIIEEFKQEEKNLLGGLSSLVIKGEETSVKDLKKVIGGLQKNQNGSLAATHSISDDLVKIKSEMKTILTAFKELQNPTKAANFKK